MCLELSASSAQGQESVKNLGLGYVQGFDSYRHHFFQSSDIMMTGYLEASPLRDIFRMFDSFDLFSDRDRLRLCLTLAKTVLRLHSTPWLPAQWTLDSLYLVASTSKEMASYLDTLHITVDLKHDHNRGIPRGRESCMERDKLEEEDGEALDEAYCLKGIRNPILYGLGVALLQIGLWEPVDLADHVQVRRRVSRLSYLGERYRRVTKKLVDCDFGLGVDSLCNERLEGAVYQSCVLELECLLQQVRLGTEQL